MEFLYATDLLMFNATLVRIGNFKGPFKGFLWNFNYCSNQLKFKNNGIVNDNEIDWLFFQAS